MDVESGNYPQAHLAADLHLQRTRQRQALHGRGRGRPQGQQVALRQPSSLQATDRPQTVGRTAAQHLGHRDAAVDGEIATGAGTDEIEPQDLAGANPEGSIQRHLRALQTRRHARPAHGHQGVALELQLRPQQRALQHGGGRCVAHQQVGSAQGILVERAGRRDAQVIVAFAAGVLHRGGEAGLEHLNRHAVPPADVACSLADRRGTRRDRNSPDGCAGRMCPIRLRPPCARTRSARWGGTGRCRQRGRTP